MGEIEHQMQLKRMNELEQSFQRRRSRTESELLLEANGRMSPGKQLSQEQRKHNLSLTMAHGCPLAKAKICVSVMMQQLSKEREQDRAFLFNTFITTEGEELTKLKRAVDCLGGRFDLSYLVFTFFKLRDRILLLQHFQEQGEEVRKAREIASQIKQATVAPADSYESVGAAAAAKADSDSLDEDIDMLNVPQTPPRQQQIAKTFAASKANWKPFEDAGRTLTCVLSDIDDTLFQHWVSAGLKYPVHCIFPGVQQLYAELGQLTSFISARPSAMKAHTLADFHKRLKLVNGFSIMTGKISDIMMLAVSRDRAHARMGATKYQNFVRFQSLFPEFDFFWFGDSSQGDIVFAEQSIENFPRKMVACFIHDVVLKKDPMRPKTPLARREQLATKRIYVVDNYVEAAHIAFQKNFIDAAALARVTRAAQQEFLATADLKWHSVRLQELAANNLSDAISAVNTTLSMRGLRSACVETNLIVKKASANAKQ